MKLIFSPKCLEYRAEGHPESPERVSRTYNALKSEFAIIAPEKAEERDILKVHTQNLLGMVKHNEITDPDTPNLPGIFQYALLAAGAALTAGHFALKGECAFSLMRPPGHHAGRSFLGGFCYFNNIAVVIMKLLKGVERVAILDFDCHHGNGTQDIFFGNQNVLYISLHQSPLFPETGLRPEANCINFPLPPGTGELEYVSVFERALDYVKEFKPDIVGVSAGFDAFKGDPLTQMKLEIGTFKKIGHCIAGLELPVFSVLEGGYSEQMPVCIKEYLTGLERA
jgi:acetoin utilization deacetylase AcuC-like enzyme